MTPSPQTSNEMQRPFSEALGTPKRSAAATGRRAGLVAAAVSAVRAGPHLAARRPRERRTARLLDRLVRDGYVVFHDLAVPGNASANVDHLVIGPSGVFVIDSKQWSGSVHQGADGLAWHNHYRLDRTLETVRWEAETVGLAWASTPMT